jgi:peptidase E
LASNKIKPGLAADDGVAVHYIEEVVSKIVSSRPGAKAYKVDKAVKKIELNTEYLGSY